MKSFERKMLLYAIHQRITAIIIFLLMHSTVLSQDVFPLYSDSIPNSIAGLNKEVSEYGADSILRIRKVSLPTLAIYLPDPQYANGTAVIICPGGGYTILAASHEGSDVAKKFTEMGVTAFVLKYRLPDDSTMSNKTIGPIQDAQRAIQLVRSNAAKWNLRPDRIGIMGFSAGGHLASTAGTHFDKTYISNSENISLRPDFMILVYPVISFSERVGHSGSRLKLLGPNPDSTQLREYSNEMHVTKNTPPTFMVHAKNDPVKVDNTLLFEEALKKNNVPVRVHLYESGGHGYGMNNPTSDVKWMDLVRDWLLQTPNFSTNQ